MVDGGGRRPGGGRAGVRRTARRSTTPAQIAAEALRVERACVTTYAALVAATTGADRGWAVEALSAGRARRSSPSVAARSRSRGCRRAIARG